MKMGKERGRGKGEKRREKGERGKTRGERGKEKEGKGLSLGERQDGGKISVLGGKAEKKGRRRV